MVRLISNQLFISSPWGISVGALSLSCRSHESKLWLVHNVVCMAAVTQGQRQPSESDSRSLFGSIYHIVQTQVAVPSCYPRLWHIFFQNPPKPHFLPSYSDRLWCLTVSFYTKNVYCMRDVIYSLRKVISLHTSSRLLLAPPFHTSPLAGR